jgi:hypothetical protein
MYTDAHVRHGAVQHAGVSVCASVWNLVIHTLTLPLCSLQGVRLSKGSVAVLAPVPQRLKACAPATPSARSLLICDSVP